MTYFRLRLTPAAMLALSAVVLVGCAGTGTPTVVDTPAAPPVVPAMPASIRADEIVGRWGYASYHKDTDRVRTEAAARGQCGHPFIIGRSASGSGVTMLMHDSKTPQELVLKGGPGGKNYVGPPGEAAQPNDREILSFDGRVLQLRWIDPEVHGRYGTSVLVRCGPRA